MLVKPHCISWLSPFTQSEQGQGSAAGTWHLHLSAAHVAQLEKHCLRSTAKGRKEKSTTATALVFPRKGPSPTL